MGVQPIDDREILERSVRPNIVPSLSDAAQRDDAPENQGSSHGGSPLDWTFTACGNLVKHINHLFAPANKISRGEVALLENVLQPFPRGPAKQWEGELGRELRRFRHVVLPLTFGQARAMPSRFAKGSPKASAREIPGVHGLVISSWFIDKRCHHCGEFRWRQFIPELTAQGLGNKQISFSVNSSQRMSVWCEGNVVFLGHEVAALQEHRHNSIKNKRNGGGPATYLAAQTLGVALQFPPAFRPSCVGLSIGAGVAGVALHGRAKAAEVFADITR